MALVQGEDSESDEEINTEQLQSLVLTPDGSITGYREMMKAATSAGAGVVMGEESETDEEDSVVEQTDGPSGGDGGGGQTSDPTLSSVTSSSSAKEFQREESIEPIAVPPSLLHKKLRECNQSLRKNMVERIIKMYRVTCRNLTLVNNNLSKAQGTVETVNSNLKRTEHELSELNTTIKDINLDAKTLAPTLRIQPPLHRGAKKSPSPIRQRILKGIPQFLGAAPKTTTTSEDKERKSQVPKIPEARPVSDIEARPEGESSAEVKTGQDSDAQSTAP